MQKERNYELHRNSLPMYKQVGYVRIEILDLFNIFRCSWLSWHILPVPCIQRRARTVAKESSVAGFQAPWAWSCLLLLFHGISVEPGKLGELCQEYPSPCSHLFYFCFTALILLKYIIYINTQLSKM